MRKLTPVALALATCAAVVAGGGTPALSAVADRHQSSPRSSPPKPTVILVHGAFADSSSWNGVIERLRRDGYPVRAVANPLRGVASDAASVRSLINTVHGPVILVGHSYGGAVITAAAAGDPDVRALVYIAAFTPDSGESLGSLLARPVEHPAPPLPLQPVRTGAGGTDLYLDPARFRASFAADVDKSTAADMAATQRPLNQAALSESLTAAAWKTIPSWYLLTRQDHNIAPDLQRYMAERAKAHITEVDSSHAVMVSHPCAVADIIEAAARRTTS